VRIPPDAIDVDPGARLARVGGEVTWAELDAATQEHGLAVTGARVSRLRVADTVLGGEGGWLERMLGPACASLTGAELELPDGSTIEADAELLWALRGGGGGLPGAITELRLRLHPVGPVLLCGFLGFARELAAEVAGVYAELMASAPEEAGGALALFAGRGGALNVVFSYAGPVEEGERLVAPLRELGPSLDAVQPNEYRAFQGMTDTQNPLGMRVREHGGHLCAPTAEALEALIAAANFAAPALSRVMLRPLGGAMARLDTEAMALRVPDAAWAWDCTAMWPPVDSLGRLGAEWADRIRDVMLPFHVGAVADPERDERLAAIRGRYATAAGPRRT
jgi:hypothetical protein